MNLHHLLRDSAGRYLTADERDRVVAYARELPARVRAGAEVEAAEDDAVEAACAALQEAYPRFGRVHVAAWERLIHDLRLILRADVQALIADDLDGLGGQALSYLRSIWTAYHVTPAFARDVCERLADEVRGRLSPEAYSEIEPYLIRNVEVLGDVPEPALAAV